MRAVFGPLGGCTCQSRQPVDGCNLGNHALVWVGMRPAARTPISTNRLAAGQNKSQAPSPSPLRDERSLEHVLKLPYVSRPIVPL